MSDDLKQPTPPSELELAKAVAEKEHGDVVATLNSLEYTLKGIILKERKSDNTDNKTLKKQYAAQIKSSKKYTASLIETLITEMKQAIKAELKVEELE